GDGPGNGRPGGASQGSRAGARGRVSRRLARRGATRPARRRPGAPFAAPGGRGGARVRPLLLALWPRASSLEERHIAGGRAARCVAGGGARGHPTRGSVENLRGRAKDSATHRTGGRGLGYAGRLRTFRRSGALRRQRGARGGGARGGLVGRRTRVGRT